MENASTLHQFETPLEVNVKNRKDEGNPLPDLSVDGKLVGRLIYLTITRPNISSVVNIVSDAGAYGIDPMDHMFDQALHHMDQFDRSIGLFPSLIEAQSREKAQILNWTNKIGLRYTWSHICPTAAKASLKFGSFLHFSCLGLLLSYLSCKGALIVSLFGRDLKREFLHNHRNRVHSH